MNIGNFRGELVRVRICQYLILSDYPIRRVLIERTCQLRVSWPLNAVEDLLDLIRVAKCHRYGRYICVNFLLIWGKILGSNIRASDVG